METFKTYLGVPLNSTIDTTDLQKAQAEREKIRLAIIAKHIASGVIFENLDGIYIDASVTIEKGAKICHGSDIRGATSIGKNCLLQGTNIVENAIIGSSVSIISSVLTNCKIGNFCTVGPNAHIHTNSSIEKSCRLGNFVEIKNSTIGINTKVAHLAYVGDSDIGNACNIGCGTIFVNYDGKNKHRSYVGDSVFIGSNSNIIAPVKIQDNAFIAAGTTVTVDLPKNCMCIGRSFETIKPERSTYRKTDYKKQYFGTDGIRGIYGEFITEKIAYLTGNYLGYSSDGGKIVVGRDNRPSGEALMQALISGILDAGADVTTLGIASTPNVAFTTTQTKSNYGIVISASHNSYEYNGIKIFNYDGRKLTNIEEIEIEKHILADKPFLSATKGESSDGTRYVSEYTNAMRDWACSLKGLKILLDCSNGAASNTAPALFKELGADIIVCNTNQDGYSINKDCGALYPNNCSQLIVTNKADCGFCFDGDADRVIALDSNGNVVNGDSIIYIIAKRLQSQNKLSGNAVVGTHHTNLGVEHSLNKLGINLERTEIGDHFVMEKMLKDNLLVGGEQSGHIILREFSNTGDGVLAALTLAKIMKETALTLAQMNDCKHFPQVNININCSDKNRILEDKNIAEIVDSIKSKLGASGRVMLRASGTEPKVRIMVESEDEKIANVYAQQIKDAIEKLN